ncbi:unnamed protein product [Rhodiola kirilowii]
MGVPMSEIEQQRRETVIVVMVIDENRDKRGNVEALNWALKHVVRPRDTVLVLGILRDFGTKHKSCLPFHIGISFSSIWEKLELTPRNEMTAMEMEEEYERKREEYQYRLQPFYSHCRKSEVKLEVKIVAGYEPRDITMEEAQNSNTRWIVLDSRLKKEALFLCGKVRCDMAVMKGRDVATLIPPKLRMNVPPLRANHCARQQADVDISFPQLNSVSTTITPKSPSWYPLSWRTGYPRAFSLPEIEAITNGFSDESLLSNDQEIKVYFGTCEETPVLVKCFPSYSETFRSPLAILSQVRHRNIMNVVGYCCTDTEAYYLSDYPFKGTLESNLTSEEVAKNLTWSIRWNIALEIGSCLRYLHEECVDGPIVHLSVSSANVVFYHDWSPVLGNFITAYWLKDESPATDIQPSEISSSYADRFINVDIHDFGVFLLELISGKSADTFFVQSEGQTLMNWASPFLESETFDELMDPRLEGTGDISTVDLMAHAAKLCLKNGLEQRVSMSKVIAVLRSANLQL